MPSDVQPRVALLLIGSELLTGKVADTNGGYCVRGLAEIGARLVEIRTVHDDPETIAAAVRELSDRADWLVTSGGIGPTHDDITLAAIASALDRPLVRHPEIQEIVERVFGPDTDQVRVWSRMAMVPEGCTLVTDPGLFLPVFRVDHIFALPGVPQLFARQFDVVRPMFAGPPTHTCVVYVTVGEGAIAEPLTAATERFPELRFGSYPVWGNPAFRTRLTVEGTVPSAVEEATRWLVDSLDPGVVHEVVFGQRALED